MMRSHSPVGTGDQGGFVTRRARLSTFVVCVALVLTGLAVSHTVTLSAQRARPNIVLIFPDNLGWGEVLSLIHI